MAVTRRSTRQSGAANRSVAPKYAESSSESENPKRNGKPASRPKRSRDVDASDEDLTRPPAKKATKAKSKASLSSFPIASKAAAVPATISDTNRDEHGNQEVYWLLKAEPLPRYENGVNVAFSIDDLKACTEPEPWSGVRNPQARNNMQAMRKGDLGFFYHSNAKPSGVVGILRVVKEAEVDETAFDPKDPYHDPKSDRKKPKWYCVAVEFVEKFDEVVDLQTIKKHAEKGGELEGMQLVTNSRLSVSRVSRQQWDLILGLAKKKDD